MNRNIDQTDLFDKDKTDVNQDNPTGFYSMSNCNPRSTHICDESEKPICGTNMKYLRKDLPVKIEGNEIYERWNTLGKRHWVKYSTYEFCRRCFNILNKRSES